MNVKVSTPKTRLEQGAYEQRLDKLGIAGDKVLLVEGLENLNLHLASRNRPELTMLDATSLNVYEVLNHRWIVATEPAVRSLAEVLS